MQINIRASNKFLNDTKISGKYTSTLFFLIILQYSCITDTILCFVNILRMAYFTSRWLFLFYNEVANWWRGERETVFKSTEALLRFSLYFFLRNNDYQIKVFLSQVFYRCVKQPLGLAKRKVNNLEKTSTKMVISWFRLAGMEFCPVLPGSRQCYKFFRNFILQLHVTSFIPARRNPSFELPGCRFAGKKFSHVVSSACLSAMKKSINTSVWKIYRSTFQ